MTTRPTNAEHAPVADRAKLPPPIDATGLHRRFRQGHVDVHALRGVDVSVRAGEIVAIVGPSGSGKSTLLHLLGGLDTPDAGQVRLAGRDISSLEPRELALVRRRQVGFLLQFFSLFPTMTAWENVAFPLLLDRVDDARARATAALEQVGLADRAEHAPAQLSGGEQQRVALARALVVKPAVVLADEPTGNLDSSSGADVLDRLREAADAGQGVVLVTHDARVSACADCVLRIVDGRVRGEDRA